MSLSEQQIASLLKKIADGELDDLDCDGCFEQMAEFADARLLKREIPEALRAVEVHLQQCACCRSEYTALLDGLKALDEGAE